MLRILICGSRSFCDYQRLENEVMRVIYTYIQNGVVNIKNKKDIEIVSGGAQGADFLAEVFAKKFKCSLKVFKAQWDVWGKSAGMIRNKEMAFYTNKAEYKIVLSFWDGESKGTCNMIKESQKMGIDVKVVEFNV